MEGWGDFMHSEVSLSRRKKEEKSDEILRVIYCSIGI